MKSPAIIFSVILLPVLFIMTSCDKATNSEINYDFPEPIDSVARNITVEFYSSFNDSLLMTTQLDMEADIVIEITDSIPYNPWGGLSVLAYADGFYTKVFNCHNGDIATIDLDAIPQMPYSATGVIYIVYDMVYSTYYGFRPVDIDGPNDFHLVTSTDVYGRFGVGNLPIGTYTLSLGYTDDRITVEIINSENTNYYEIRYNQPIPIEAPYLYLYPEETTDVTVELEFLQGGHVTESEPPYNNGWNVNVTPNGTIDGEYDYLFYEGVIPHIPRPETGWIINGFDLAGGIAELLEGLGFDQNEIDDFVEFWVPEIEGDPYYAFFYLDPDSIIGLNISPAPDNVLRAFFVIRPLQQPIELSPPDLAPGFSRDGFTAVEWGVLGWR